MKIKNLIIFILVLAVASLAYDKYNSSDKDEILETNKSIEESNKSIEGSEKSTTDDKIDEILDKIFNSDSSKSKEEFDNNEEIKEDIKKVLEDDELKGKVKEALDNDEVKEKVKKALENDELKDKVKKALESDELKDEIKKKAIELKDGKLNLEIDLKGIENNLKSGVDASKDFIRDIIED